MFLVKVTFGAYRDVYVICFRTKFHLHLVQLIVSERHKSAFYAQNNSKTFYLYTYLGKPDINCLRYLFCLEVTCSIAAFEYFPKKVILVFPPNLRFSQNHDVSLPFRLLIQYYIIYDVNTKKVN